MRKMHNKRTIVVPRDMLLEEAKMRKAIWSFARLDWSQKSFGMDKYASYIIQRIENAKNDGFLILQQSSQPRKWNMPEVDPKTIKNFAISDGLRKSRSPVLALFYVYAHIEEPEKIGALLKRGSVAHGEQYVMALENLSGLLFGGGSTPAEEISRNSRSISGIYDVRAISKSNPGNINRFISFRPSSTGRAILAIEINHRGRKPFPGMNQFDVDLAYGAMFPHGGDWPMLLRMHEEPASRLAYVSRDAEEKEDLRIVAMTDGRARGPYSFFVKAADGYSVSGDSFRVSYVARSPLRKVTDRDLLVSLNKKFDIFYRRLFNAY